MKWANLASLVTVVELVIITRGKVTGKALLNFFVCESVAHSGINLIQRLPLKLGVRQELPSLNCPLECACPHGQGLSLGKVLRKEFGQTLGVLETVRAEV